MKLSRFLLAVVLSLTATVVFAKIPLDQIIKRAVYGAMKISPDGKHFAATRIMDDGDSMLYIIDRKTMEVTGTQTIDGRYGIGPFQWANNERVLLTLTYNSATFEGSGAMGLIAAMNIDGTRKEIIWGGDNTADYGGYEGAALLGKADESHYHIMVAPSGSSMAKTPFVYLYKLNIYTAKAEKIAKSPARLGEFIRNSKGQITHFVGSAADHFDKTVVVERDLETDKWKEKQITHNKDGAFIPLSWSSDGKSMLYSGNTDAETKGMYRVNMESGEKELIYRHPKVDYSAVRTDNKGQIWGMVVEHDYPEMVYLDEENHYAKTHKKLQATFPDSWVVITSSTSDGNEYLVNAWNDKSYGKYYLYNEYDGTLKFLLDPRPWVDEKALPPSYPVRFTARDGLEINGVLTLPVGKEKNLPLIVLPHGGPYGIRDHWSYSNERTIFANAGYAVLAVNYRGSGGYGKSFHYDWYGHWGLEMQDDLTDATHWAIQEGIADPDRLAIYGASYGGYAALQGVVKEPDLYKCAIGYVGVYDLNVMATRGDITLRDAGAGFINEAIGATYEDRKARSPAPNADRIKVPVFLVHGKRDIRAHWKNYEVMREALIKKNHRFETLVIPRAGHGARKLESHYEVYSRMLDFFDRHIGDKKPSDPPLENCTLEGETPLPYEYFEGKKDD